MDDSTFKARMEEMQIQIASLPDDQRGPLQALMQETRDRHEQIKLATAQARDALDDWRLLMKYLIFDREAIRRELDDLRRRQGEV